MPYPRHHVCVLLTFAWVVQSASGHITTATCQICEDSDTHSCSGFLPSLPLRTATAIITTALGTGILAAWQSAGAGSGRFWYTFYRTLVQALLPEVALWHLHHIGYAMWPKFDPQISSARAERNCNEFRPTKAQITAIHLGLLAVNTKPPYRPIANAIDAMHYVEESHPEVNFHSSLQSGYRIISLEEAVFLPHLLRGLPKGRSTVYGMPVPQISMVLLAGQTLYYIASVLARAGQGLYTTVLEWFFIPPACALLVFGLMGLLWEPAWKDIAHVNMFLGEKPESFPWRFSNKARAWFALLLMLVVPIGPVTLVATYTAQVFERPYLLEMTLLSAAALWTVGIFVLAIFAMAGFWQPFGGQPNTQALDLHDKTGACYSALLVLVRLATLVVAIMEFCNLPSEAYIEVSWAQYIPHF